MATKENFTTANEGWSLVAHFVGNAILRVRLVIDVKIGDWQSKVAYQKERLTGDLKQIADHMAIRGQEAEGAKVAQLSTMVEEGDLTDVDVLNAICEKHLELNDGARVFRDEFEKLRATREK